MDGTTREALVRVERMVGLVEQKAKAIAEFLSTAMENTNYAEYCDPELLTARLVHMSCINEIDLFVVYGKEGAVSGVAIGRGGMPWYSTDMMYFEEIVAVHPYELNAMYNARVLRKLHDALESAAEVRGCKDIIIGTSSGHRPAAYIRVLEKRGYSLLGTSMRKEIK